MSETDFQIGLPLVHSGKVRDIFRVDDERLLIVASDRLSAFDVVLPDLIPDKGAILTQLSNFWFTREQSVVANHLTDTPVNEVVANPRIAQRLAPRAVVARRLEPVPIEAVVRGYIAGSGWRDYREHGHICGIELPPGLRQADRLPEPVFTPSTKAAQGEHDRNIDWNTAVKLIGSELAQRIHDVSLELYNDAATYALERGIIIADSKFEFGLDRSGRLVLMDELFTPDSSRFWPRERYQPGQSPPSYDKQFVRDYLDNLDWDKQAPGPSLPRHIIDATAERYRTAYETLTGEPWKTDPSPEQAR